MSDNTKYDRILEGLGELKGVTKSMEQDIQLIKKDVNTNTKDLAKHIAGVETNVAGIQIQADRLSTEIEVRDRLLTQQKTFEETERKKLEKRLEVVEFLPKLAIGLWKVSKWIGALAVAVIAVTKLLGFW